MALYDPAPRETVEAPSLDFTVADVLAWARTKPAYDGYDYGNPNACAICQFLIETGRASRPSVSGASIVDMADPARPELASHRLRGVLDEAAVKAPNVYGALADRLERLVK